MKRFLIWSLAGVCLAGSACTQNDAEELPAPQEPTRTEGFYLSDETSERAADPSSRAYFSDGYKIAWETGDSVSDVQEVHYPVRQDTDGRWFVELPESDSYLVWYPASAYDGYRKVSTSVQVHALLVKVDQNYRAGSFDPAAICASAIAKPGEKLVFKYCCSLVKLTLKGSAAEKVTKIDLSTANLGKEIVGSVGAASDNGDGTFDIVRLPGAYASLSTNYVSLTSAEGVPLTDAGVDFYLAVIPITYSQGFQITVTLADGRTMTRKGGVGQTAARGRILAMPALTLPTGSVYYSTDNTNWSLWENNTDGSPVTLAYPETADHRLYFKNNDSAAKPGLTAAHLSVLKTAFVAGKTAPIGFDFSQATYESTTFPADVLSGGSAANSSITYVSLPGNITVTEDAVKNGGKGVFFNNQMMEEVVFPASVQLIGRYTCYMCPALKRVTIEGSSTALEIGEAAFARISGGIDSFTCHRTAPPTTYTSSIPSFDQSVVTKLYVPASSLSAYQAASPWSGFNPAAIQ
ncbi:hypothetical protein [Alistipes sp.]|uniref:hypothetical protein n=1 Tax=Alistipes sp. TaxID=1872444 RepID=UPI003AF17E22